MDLRHGSENDGQVGFHDELARKQRNVVWPDTMINGSRVDRFLWDGSPDATVVQRVGAGIFGSFFFLSSFMFLAFAVRERVVFLLLFAIFWLLIGWKIFANALSQRLKQVCFQPVAVLLGVAFAAIYFVWPLVQSLVLHR
jgi:hypothetical protein